MKIISNPAILAFILGGVVFPAGAAAGLRAPASAQVQSLANAKPAGEFVRADAYYYFTLGHLQEQQYELTDGSGGSGLADQSIASYTKALELDPDSSVIQERLAEIYAKSQHIRDAVLTA